MILETGGAEAAKSRPEHQIISARSPALAGLQLAWRMKPAPFDYVRPGSLAEACEFLATDEDARLIAGGQTLVPMLAMRLARPAKLIDVLRLPELTGISEGQDAVIVGATTRQAQAERDPVIRASVPMRLREAGVGNA